MSVAAFPALGLDRASRQGGWPIARVAILVGGIVLAVALRWAAQAALPGEGLLLGAGFGFALIALTVGSGALPVVLRARDRDGWSPGSVARSVSLGASVGLALVLLAALTRTDAMPALRPAAPFLPWAFVTTLVASAEEIALRGALFGAVERIAGPLAALAGTSLLFALMHVPFYGWAAVPLDLGVGLALGGLRLWSGGLSAPIAAHVVADLATWWL